MKKIRNVSLLVLTLLPLLSCVTSCDKDRSGYNESAGGSFYCSVDWQRLWFWTEKPQTLKLYFYPASGNQIKSCEIGTDGGTVENVPVNRYDLIALSGGLENINFQGMGNYKTAEIYLSERVDKNGNSIIGQPGVIYADRCGVTITPGQTMEKEIMPVPLVKSMNFRIKTIGSASIDKYECRLSGVASAVRLNNAMPQNCKTSVVFEPEKSVVDYCARVQVFGFDTKENPPILFIDCYSNGTAKSVSVDLSEHIELFNTDAAACTIELDFNNTDISLNPVITVVDWKNGENGNIELP